MSEHEHKHVNAFGMEESVTTIAALIGKTGATSLEIQYDRADGPPLEGNEEPGPDDAVKWTAVAEYPEGHSLHPQVVGLYVAAPGTNQGTGLVSAMANLARELGANVTIVGG